MRRETLGILAAAVWALAACGSGGPAPQDPGDPGPSDVADRDTRPDPAGPDAREDLPGIDLPTDLPTDLPPADVPPDAIPDGTPPDGPAEAGPDTPPDLPADPAGDDEAPADPGRDDDDDPGTPEDPGASDAGPDPLDPGPADPAPDAPDPAPDAAPDAPADLPPDAFDAAPDTPDATACEPGTGCFGEACAGDDDCLSGPCVPHLGALACSQPCDGACPEGWECPADGPAPRHCRSRTPYACLPGDCDDGNPCTDDACDPATGCSQAFNAAGCDDRNPCTDGDFCDAGTCRGGTPRACDDGLACTTDRCDVGTGACAHDREAGACVIDGACVPDGTAAPSGPCLRCNASTRPDAWSPSPAGLPCDDGDACTDGDRCDAGACGGTPRGCVDRPPECAAPDRSRAFAPGTCDPATGLCSHASTETPCPFGCDDDTGLCRPDPCLGVACAGPPDPRCFVVPGTCQGGTCTYAPRGGGSPCEDGDPCTDGDACDGAGTCLAGPPLACDDPPDPRCVQPLGQCAGGDCAYEPLLPSTPCDDGNPCTDGDACDGAGTCLAGTPRTCQAPAPFCRGDDRVDSAAACDPATGACATTETATACPFGCDPATAACRPDPCLGVACLTPPEPRCHAPVGTCQGGTCTYATLDPGTPCDDGDACTLSDACDAAQACAGTPRTCTPPGPACTPGGASRTFSGGTCTPGTGACAFDAVDTPCDRGCDPATGRCNRILIGEFRTRGPTGGNDEYVSIFNAGAVAVDLSGWTLNASNATGLTGVRATIPSGTVVPPRGSWLLVNVPTGGGGYTGTTPADQSYATGVNDAGGYMLADPLGFPVDRVGMIAEGAPATGSAYVEGTPLPALVVNQDRAYRRRTVDCGPDRDTGDNAADFEAVTPSTPRGSRSCPLACTGRSCTAPSAGCTDAWTYTAWTPACSAAGVCEPVPAHTACEFGCDLLQGACRTQDCAVLCDDQDWCTVDSCDLLGFCQNVRGATCCGDRNREAGEECDDGNRDDGDGCTSDCRLECPAGSVLEQGVCFVKAAGAAETQAQACARLGRAPTLPGVAVTWDAATLSRLSAAFGHASLGDTGDFAPGMWCDPAGSACHTHAFGSRFLNHGARPDNAALVPVYTCAQAGVPAPALPVLKAHFIEIGQGDSILLDLGETEVLIDGGPGPDEAADYIAPYVDGVLEAVVCTHPHADHHGGLDEVLGRYAVGEVWVNGSLNASLYQQFLDLAAAEPGCVTRVVDRGDSAFAGDLAITVLGPPVARFNDFNEDSMVLRLAWGAVSFVFTGDMELDAEASVLATGAPLKSDVLKVAHHASSTSSGEPWVDAVKPSLAVYQAELGNPYGHPHADVVARYAANGIPLLGTDTRGSIVVTTDGTTFSYATAR